MAPTIEPLNAGEVAWRAQQLETARRLAEILTGESEPLPSLERLDAVIASWRAQAGSSSRDVNLLVNAVGIAFGEHVARDTGLEWVIATDQWGADMALHGQPGDVLLHPKSAVAKRITAGECGFTTPLHRALVAEVRQIRA